MLGQICPKYFIHTVPFNTATLRQKIMCPFYRLGN